MIPAPLGDHNLNRDLLFPMFIFGRAIQMRFIQQIRRFLNPTLPFLGFLLGLGMSGSIAQAQVPTAQLREEVRIGSVWDPDRMLTLVGGLAVYGDSLLLVLQTFDHAIRVFDWSGEPVGRIGRYGSGPGEFRNPVSVGVRNDTIFVRDTGSGSLVLLNISGDELARFSFPGIVVAEGFGAIRGPVGIFPDGTFLGIVTSLMPQAMEERQEYHLPTLKVGRSGEVLDTLCLHRMWTGRTIRPESGPGVISLPGERPSEIAAYSAARGIVAVADPLPQGHEAQYRITSIHHTGDTIFSRLYTFQPRRIRGETKAALVLDRLPSAEKSARVRTAVEEAIEALPYVPPVSRLRIDRDGRFWVGREKVPGEPVLWEVLSPLGEPLFRVELPAAVYLSRASGDLLWTEEEDDLGVPFIVRYRILIPD